MPAPNPLRDAFIHLANNWSAAVRNNDRVAVQGGDRDDAISRKQTVLNEVDKCLALVEMPEGVKRK